MTEPLYDEQVGKAAAAGLLMDFRRWRVERGRDGCPYGDVSFELLLDALRQQDKLEDDRASAMRLGYTGNGLLLGLGARHALKARFG